MALKRKLTKAEFDKLSEALQFEYKEDGDGYTLDLDGDVDTGALKRAKDREVQARKDAEKRAQEAEDKLADLDEVGAKKRGDIETLEKSWAEKHTAAELKYSESLAKKDTFIKNALVNDVANGIANKISTSPALLLPHIKARLSADLDGDTPTTKILDAKGELSAMTIDELSSEFVANKDYSSIIIGSKANGSRTPDANKPNFHSDGDGKPIDLSKLSTAEKVAHVKAKLENTE